MVNLEWYRTFKAIFENGTLTKASLALFTSQPGVSLHLNALEAYVGKKLFERTSRKMIPTEDGKLLYAFIVDSISKLEKAEQHFKKTSQERNPTLHIGMCSETFQLILEPEVPKLKFDLVARFGTHAELIKDLNNGILDLVITPIKQDEKGSMVVYTPFSKERMILVAGKNTDTKDLLGNIELENWSILEQNLRKKTWYSASNEMEHFSRFWFENFKKRQDFKPNFILPNISSIIRCLSNDQGFAIIPDFLGQKAIDKKEIQLIWTGKEKTENTLYFATRTDLKYKKEVSFIQQIFMDKMGTNER